MKGVIAVPKTVKGYERRKVLVVHRRTTIFTAVHKKRGGTYVIKRHVSPEAGRREMAVMRAYGDAPNLVRCRKFFELDGMGYIVMQRVPGKTLRKLISAHGPFAPDKTVAIASNILKGLAALHKAGYVHGDLHSGNVIVSTGKRPKATLIDLQHAVRKTKTGKARTLRFLARPPRFAPESGGVFIDDAYDIYGVGYMSACMLVGKELSVSPHQVAMAGVDRRLWEVILQATDPNPGYRFPSAAKMRAALRSISV